jgi:hypothetical protein
MVERKNLFTEEDLYNRYDIDNAKEIGEGAFG